METRSMKREKKCISPYMKAASLTESEDRKKAALEFLEDMVPDFKENSESLGEAVRDGSLLLRAALEVEERMFGDSIIPRDKIQKIGSSSANSTPRRFTSSLWTYIRQERFKREW